jgi:ElaA protein
MTTLRWRLAPFDDLTGRQVHDLLRLRQAVFVVEQNCPFAEIDGRDPLARHLMGSRDGALLACARLLPATAGKPRAIGRVATAPDARGQGLGRAVMVEAMRILLAEDAAAPIALSAQAHLVARLYAPLGFAIVGAPYEEDGIAHVDMRLDPQGPSNSISGGISGASAGGIG